MANDPTNTTAPGTALTAPVQSGVPAIHEPASQLPAVIRRNINVLRPIADAVMLVEVQQESRELIAKLLKDGKDFGTVPGVKKPTLFKPGAEKFNNAYGLRAHFIVVEKEVDHYKQIDWTKTKTEWSGRKGQRRATDKIVSGTSFGLYRYVIECQLIDRATGEVVGSSLGSCSTLESKYIDRPRDLENTIIKMAEKRALIGTTLLVHGLSEQFTQDVEDTGVASDDTQAIAVAPQDDQQNMPEVGSAEWAIGYPIPGPVHQRLKVSDDITTMGQLNWKQLAFVVAGADSVLQVKPGNESYTELRRAAVRMQDELEERAAIGTVDASAAGGEAAAPAAEPDKPTLNPLAHDGGGVPAPRSAGEAPAQTADGKDIDDDLPF